jgi:parallel beta-helix repeat protein
VIDPLKEVPIPGVTKSKPGLIHIEGELKAIGTPSEPIRFESGVSPNRNLLEIADTATDTVLQHVVVVGRDGRATGIHIEGSSTLISHVDISAVGHGIDVRESGSPVVKSSRLCSNLFGLLIGSGSVAIHDSVICDNGSGISLAGSGNITAIDNTITGNGTALEFAHTKRDSNYFSGNMIASNGTAIRMYVPLGAETSESGLKFQFNQVYDNSLLAVELIRVEADLLMPNNWWGTTDVSTIEDQILDFNDDFQLGDVSVEPVLTSPDQAIGMPRSP